MALGGKRVFIWNINLLYHFCVCNRLSVRQVFKPVVVEFEKALRKQNYLFCLCATPNKSPWFPISSWGPGNSRGELSMPSPDYSVSDVTEALHKLLLRKHRLTWPFWGSQWLLCHLLFISTPFSGGWSLQHNLLLQHLGQCPACLQACQSWQARGNLWGNSGAQTLTG